MIKPENRHHAVSARKGLTAAYNTVCSAAIVDMLADLRHLCDELGLEFHKLDRRAYRGYSDEGGAQ